MSLVLTRPVPQEGSTMSQPSPGPPTSGPSTSGPATPTTSPGLDVSAAFAEHGSALLGFAVNALRDRPLAEDCVQETFLRAWRARASFDPARGGARTWLFAIERRVVLDVHRARQRTPVLVPDEHAPEQAAPAADPLERLGIVEGLARLSDEHREVVVAVHLTGLSYQEFSDLSGVPVATLRTRCFYALRALRTHLDDGENLS